MNELAIVNARVVLPRQLLDGGSVIVKDGQIAAIVADAPRDFDGPVCDADGAFLMPGVIDLHNDGYELEINPRPDSHLPMDLALATFERALLGAGVLTEFHAVSYHDQAAKRRTIDGASLKAQYLTEEQSRGDRVIDHFILHRLDVWTPESFDAIMRSLATQQIRYLSLNDHTPGQGQYRDIDKHAERLGVYRALRGGPVVTPEELKARAAERRAMADRLIEVYQQVYAAQQRLHIVIATHDDDTVEKVEQQHAHGATVCEFPVTVEAAERAHALGMHIVVGAPNVVRGGSHSGNLDAATLFERGLADIICADYHAASMIPAAFKLVADGLTDLPTSVRALTLNPARAVGITDRGAIAVGQRADMLLVRQDRHGVPRVAQAFRAGVAVFQIALTVSPVRA